MKRIFFLLLLISAQLFAQKPAELADSLKKGFRGLSVVNENVIWLSGRKGLVGLTKDQGKTFDWTRVNGFEKLDFRSLHAFDEKTALIASAGTPAVILRTEDGAKTWKTVYRSDDSIMFFDGIAFWDANHGIIFGDPVNGSMFLMETTDGGKSWKGIPFEQRPKLEKGEASFAASGTSICVLPGGHVWTATGGTKARLFHSRDYGHHWETIETPMIHGSASQGIFSVCFLDTARGVIVGGDYTNDSLKSNHVFHTKDGGKTWVTPVVSTGGYRSCVTGAFGHVFYTCGPKGYEMMLFDYEYRNRAFVWNNSPLNGKGANVLQFSPDGKILVEAGCSSAICKIYSCTYDSSSNRFTFNAL